MASFDPKLLLAKDRETVAWKNGGGTATEVASGLGHSSAERASADDFAWRVSIAAIETDADFSAYPGIQRYLMPLSATGLTITVDGDTRVLPGFEQFEFAGESVVRAIDVTQPSLDLNLMVRRGWGQDSSGHDGERASRFGHGKLTAHAVDGSLVVAAASNENVVIVMLDAGFGFAALDAVELLPDSNLNLQGTGMIVVARITNDTLE